MPELLVRRDKLSETRIVDGESADAELEQGEALLRVERFALTTNNVSYADEGDRLGYWKLFPAPEGWGRMPAWGYTRVERSRSDVEVGRRAFGLVPMGSYARIRPADLPFGFFDTAAHRRELAPVYNTYLEIADEGNDLELVMRPLFMTSIALDLVLAKGEAGGTVIVTSASSKTALGLAHLLRERPARSLGLTSERNREWASNLGLYDEVLAYEDAGSIEVDGGAALVDIAGEHVLRRELHELLGDALRRSLRVGFAHRAGPADELSLPGPDPEFFFAPNEIARFGAELGKRYSEAWPEFAPVVERILRIERIRVGDGLIAAYRDLAAGRIDPSVALVASV